MKIALVIHSFMLILVAGLAWLDRNGPTLLWSCPLALPHLLSAIQCIREIQHAGRSGTVASKQGKRSVLTLGFYATMGLVCMLLRPDCFKIDPFAARMLAVVCALMGLVAWEASRPGRFPQGKTVPPTDRGILIRFVILGAGSLLFILVFALALPISSDALCRLSTGIVSPQGTPQRKPGGKSAASGEGPSLEGPELANRTGQVHLPMRGTLDLGDEIRVMLKFEDPSTAVKPTRQRPLYIRTLSVSRFDDDGWVGDSTSGHWLDDPADGREDGKVEVGSRASGESACQIYLLRSNGQALPALAGVTAYALPAVFVLPDDWYQNPASGDIRYRAWSSQVDIQSLAGMKPEPGKPGPAYLTRLETPFGARLTETAALIGDGHPDLLGRLESLRRFFQSNFIYSMTVENKSNQPPLANFLFEEKKGYCDFFASASALMLRHMGIPSRVACGYMGGEHDDATDCWIFQAYHAHSWTEVFVEGHGWVICDFTPPSDDSPSLAGNPPPSLDLAAFEDAGTGRLNQETRHSDQSTGLRAPWIPAILVFGGLVPILGLILLKQRTPEQRAVTMAARKRARSEQQPDYLLDFLRMCSSFGHTRREGQTLMEFHRGLKQAGLCHDDFDELTDYYYKSRYEDAPPDRPSERRFLKLIRRFRKEKAEKSTESQS